MSAYTSPSFTGRIITESSNSVNVREEASTYSGVVGSLRTGNTYVFHAEDHTADPYNRNYAIDWLAYSPVGYVSAQYVAWEYGLNSGNNMHAFVAVTSGYLNLRKTPSTSTDNVIGRLEDDVEVLWLNFNNSDYTGEWALVATPEGTGWVKSVYLDRHG